MDLKKIYKMKRTVSAKQFIAELGGNFSSHIRKRLLELGERCVLTRRDESYILDLRHIEHTKYHCNSEEGTAENLKEYAFGRFIVYEDKLYFSKGCLENEEIMQSKIVDSIYDSLQCEELELEGDVWGKPVDDGNIDYIVDEILKVCPEMSPEHLAIISRY